MYVYFAFWFVSIVVALFVRTRLATIVFMATVFLFLGLRYETGFDWPIYKEIFGFFVEEFSFQRVLAVQLIYSQEIGFLLLLSAMAQVFPNYEVCQALFSLLFIYSVVKLSDIYSNSRPALALALYFGFFLLAVGFSTIRQTLAMSLFNLGLYFFFRRKSIRQYIFFGAAVSTQVSTGMLVAAFMIARVLAIRNRVPGVLSLLILSTIALFLVPVAFAVGMLLSPHVAERLKWSIEMTSISSLGYFNILLLLYSGFIGGMASSKIIVRSDANADAILLRTLIVVLSAMMVAFSFFPVFRDRIGYELVLLFCIFVSNPRIQLRYPAMIVTLAVGLLYQWLILRGISELAFVPYQNSIIMAISGAGSTGAERSATYMSIFNEMFR